MASGSEPLCVLCRTVPQRKDRRKITNSESVLLAFLNELEPSSAAEAMVRNGFLCRPCLRSVEKLIKLRKEVKKSEEEFKRRINVFAAELGVTRARERAATTPEKRRRDVEGDLPIPAAKRSRYDTPVRRRLQQMIPTGSSPSVSVSIPIAISRSAIYHLRTRVSCNRFWLRDEEKQGLTLFPSPRG